MLFLFQSLLPHSDYATIGLYAGSSFGLGVLALLLPIETKGRALKVYNYCIVVVIIIIIDVMSIYS